ncbi:MAG: hypothetical protein EVB03_09065 [SAR92 clade bacterium]|uniref:SPOR domain-containing protein n=1 Tax=SAR92 clade bacterium TaxID=2315479 RepID=A0A520MD24_9GAMM|nr:MAG: hypothetical protein EVB03_09065 [SAR92 clade bacterium]
MPKFLSIITPLLLACLLLGACSSVSTTPSNSKTSPTSALEIATSKSFADIPIAATDKVDIEKSLLLNPGEYWIGRAVLKSSLKEEEAFNYYKNKMSDYDWTTVTSVQSKVSILTFEKFDRFAAVQIQSAGMRGSAITITVSPRESSK